MSHNLTRRAGSRNICISGATPSSKVIKDGVNNCIVQAIGMELLQGDAAASAQKLNPQDYSYTSNSITDFTKTTLFSDWKLGPLTLHNRMVKAAAYQLAFIRNKPEEYITYYENFAKGGVEMIWVEDFASFKDIMPKTVRSVRNEFDTFDVKGLLDAIHGAGSYAGYQYSTMGSELGPDFYPEENYIANYSTEEILSWQQGIIGIAKKLKDTGFDAFEFNCAANNLGQSFLSRSHNNRTDEYGPQSIENRCRWVTEIIRGIKEVCGKDFVVQVLINGIEENDKKLGDSALYATVEETKDIARMLEAAGADSLHVRLGTIGEHICQFASDLYFTARGFEGATVFGTQLDFSRHFQGKLIGNHSGCGMMLDVAKEIKSAVSIPVGTVTYMDPAHAPDFFENALKESKVDFLSMNRPLFVDTQYVNKLREGRIDEIAPCTRCMHCFYDADLFSKNIVKEQAVLDEYGKLTITGMEYDPEAMKDSVLEHCRVNASSWRAYGGRMPEGFNPLPANGSKNVMVVGAGPAGMEAARIAAQRGYDVTLYEKKRSVGGLLSFAHAVKGPHENLKRLRIYLQRQQEIMGVTVVTNKEVDADFIKAQNPDVVILAVGGKRGTSGLSGTSGTRIISIDDALRANIGDNVTIIGSNCQAVDVAVYLLSRGKHVTIVTPDPMSDFDKGHSVNVMEKVKALILAKGTRVWPDSSITAVGNGEITIHNETGVDIADVVIKCDTIIEAMDALPNTDLLNGLSGIETHAIGDCSIPYNISEAISSGNLTARKI